MFSYYEVVSEQLTAIEMQLQQLHLWQNDRPSPEKLASALPFCCDTLAFPQWLQFVFLEKMWFLLESALPLPSNCVVAPYAEEYFKNAKYPVQILLAHLETIDKLLCEQS